MQAEEAFGLFGDTQRLLLKYHEKDQTFFIKLSDILDTLEYHMNSEMYFDVEPVLRLSNFIIQVHQQKGGASYVFPNLSILNLIDIFFTTQVEYHGMYLIAANDSMSTPDFVDRTLFNSAKVSEMGSISYFENIKESKNYWDFISAPYKEELIKWAFPYPEKHSGF